MKKSNKKPGIKKSFTKKNVIVILTAVVLLAVALVFLIDALKPVKVVISVKDYGKITLELDRKNAPLTVKHFVKLCRKKAYDGAYFTRMQYGFVLQGGEGCTDSSTVKGEFSENGVDNQIEHKKGVISMARSDDPDSASNNFFIVLDDSAQSSLDGLYAGFGWVVDGWDVVEAICNDAMADEYYAYYYYYNMGILPEDDYIQIESIRVK